MMVMVKNDRRALRLLGTAMVAVGGVGCGDSTGVDDPKAVALNFRVSTTATPASAVARSTGPAAAAARVAGAPLEIVGTNGTLILNEIRLILAEVELEGEDDACNDDLPGSDDCADFEALPRFLDLPLDGQPVEAFVGLIPPGTYEELEFEVEDLEDDEGDPILAAAIAELRAQILNEIPDWPRKASAMIAGTFQSASSGTVSFRVFLEAEIEVERDLNPHLVVGSDGGSSVDLSVNVRPDIWFTRSDGSVLPLHLYDFETTGQLLEFEIEMEDGFTQIEIGS